MATVRTAEEITDEFFEAVLGKIDHALRTEKTDEDRLQLLVFSLFVMLDGQDSSGFDSFTLKYKGKEIAPGDYIHEAWSAYLKKRGRV